MQRTSIASISQKKTAAVILAIACTFGSATLASSAQAGRYHVYSCRTPSGEPAPTDGWTGSVTGSFDYDLNTCAEGGALVAALGSGASHDANTDMATWAFEPPAGETISGATLMRAGDADGGNAPGVSYFFWIAGPRDAADSADVFDQCVYYTGCTEGEGDLLDPSASSNKLVVPNANLGGGIYLNAACGGEAGHSCPAGAGDANGYAATVNLFAADIVLEDNMYPQITDLRGELAEASTINGVASAQFEATDAGSGLYELMIGLDGQPAQTSLLDPDSTRCHDLEGSSDGLPAYLYTQPCPSALTVDVPLDTTKLSNGSHQLDIAIVDAAGNATTVIDRHLTVDNGGEQSISESLSNAPNTSVTASMMPLGASATLGQPNGTDASAQAKLIAHWNHTNKTHLTVGFGHAETIMGRLTTDAGTPIAGAQIDVSDLPSYEGASTSTMRSPRTGANGQFAVHVPAGVSSRTLHLSYRARLTDMVPAASSALGLSVRPRIVLRVTPTVSHRAGTIWFVGKLWGSPIPPGGKQLVLEARSGHGPWIEFHVIRTAKNGSFRSHYRFRLSGPITYQFRIVSNFEADFPFTSGASRIDRVYER